MGYITITGDSDGDLHDADMHNSKFGAIASVLNGNIDQDNLANPFSHGTLNFHCTGTSSGAEFYDIPSATSGTIDALTGTNVLGEVNAVKESYMKTQFAFTIEDVRLICGIGSGFNNADATVSLQTATTLTGTYTKIYTKDINFYNASAGIREEVISSGTPAVDANSFLRVVFENTATGSTHYPPPFTMIVTYKTSFTS